MRDIARANLSPRTLQDVTIVLDVGHDHKDSGASHNGVVEVEFTRKQTASIKRELESRGFKVEICSNIHTDSKLNADSNRDGKVSNKERAEFANKFPKPPLLISIHADSGKDGTTIYYPNQVDPSVNANSKFWGTELGRVLGADVRNEGDTNKGKVGGLEKSRNTAPGGAVLTVEVLNIANPKEAEQAKSQAFIDKFAKRFVDALERVGGDSKQLPSGFRQQGQQEVAGITSTSQTQAQTSSVQSNLLQSTQALERIQDIESGKRSAFLRKGMRHDSVLVVKDLINKWLDKEGRSSEKFDLNSADSTLYDARLIKIVKEFQDKHGLSRDMKLHQKGGLQVDGVVGPWTLTALQLSAGVELGSDIAPQRLAACDKVWYGGVWVDPKTGEPPANYKERLKALKNFEEDDESIISRLLTDAEASGDAPEDVINAVWDTVKAHDNARYGHASDGSTVDCSMFASLYLKRLGYQSLIKRRGYSGRLNTNSINQITESEGFAKCKLSQVGNGGKLTSLRVGDIVNFPWNSAGEMGHVAVVSRIENGKIYLAESTTSADETGQDGVQEGHQLQRFIRSAAKRGFSESEITVLRPLRVKDNEAMSGLNVKFIPGASDSNLPFVNEPSFVTETAQQIFKNEAGGSKDMLAYWSDIEAFASLGMNHYLWAPNAAAAEKHGQTFPSFIRYAQSRGVNPPQWMLESIYLPWATRAEFNQAKANKDPKMTELQNFIEDTMSLQAEFSIDRAEKAFTRLQKDYPELMPKVEALFKTKQGVFAFIDYVNFKGEGYGSGDSGYGLVQVLRGMKLSDDKTPVQSFEESAKQALRRRKDAASSIKGWSARIDRYSQFAAA